MPIDLTTLKHSSRLLFEIPVKPLQGRRFQPTGFPGLGAATYDIPEGTSLLVESAQSMANRLEAVCWDEATQAPVEALTGISHVTVTRGGKFFTDTILEAHRLNSPYLLESSDKSFFDRLKTELGSIDEGPIDRRRLAAVVLKYDAGSILHGLFLAKKALAGGRLRLARCLSAFIEADKVTTAPSGGVKNDHVNPQGLTKAGFGNVPFARDEFVSDNITLFINLDLAQLRGYGLPASAEEMLTLLALYKVAALLDRGLRLRTACELEPVGPIVASRPKGFVLPSLAELDAALRASIAQCKDLMAHTTTRYEDKLAKQTDDNDDTSETELAEVSG